MNNNEYLLLSQVNVSSKAMIDTAYGKVKREKKR